MTKQEAEIIKSACKLLLQVAEHSQEILCSECGQKQKKEPVPSVSHVNYQQGWQDGRNALENEQKEWRKKYEECL